MSMEVQLSVEDKKCLNPLELELQMIVSHSVWTLGAKLGFSVRIGSILNHWAISLTPISYKDTYDYNQGGLDSCALLPRRSSIYDIKHKNTSRLFFLYHDSSS